MNKLFAVVAALGIGIGLGIVVAPATAGTPGTPGSLGLLDLGEPLLLGEKKGELVAKGVTLVLRSDGLVQWRLSDRVQKQFDEEAKKGPKVPPADYGASKR